MNNLKHELIELSSIQAYTALVSGKLGIATEFERGYHPVQNVQFDTYEEAKKAANMLNIRDGKTLRRAMIIVMRSMRN